MNLKELLESMELKDHKNERYNLEETYNNFLIYKNDREHSKMEVASFRAIMNVENNNLIYKIKENTIKRRQKAKILQKLFLQYRKSI